MNAEPPIHYTIEGSPHRYLIFRTEEGPDARRGNLCLLVPDLPHGEQQPLDVVTMYLDDPKLSNADRPHAIAILGDVFASVDLVEKSDTTGPPFVKAMIGVSGPLDDRGSPSLEFEIKVPTKEAPDA